MYYLYKLACLILITCNIHVLKLHWAVYVKQYTFSLKNEDWRTQSKRDTLHSKRARVYTKSKHYASPFKKRSLGQILHFHSCSLRAGFLGRTTMGRRGVQQRVLSWGHLPKILGANRQALQLPVPPTKLTELSTHRASTCPGSSSLPASQRRAGRRWIVQNEALLLLKAEHCCSTHEGALTRRPTPPSC